MPSHDARTLTPIPTEALPDATLTYTAFPTRSPTAAPTASSAPPTPTPECTENRGRIETGLFRSSIIGGEQPYRIYLPPCYGFYSQRYPVLYLLHGYPFDDSHWDDLGIDEAADTGIATGTFAPFLIAMPAADNEGTYTRTSGGPGSFEAVLLSEFVPFVENRYRTNNNVLSRAIGGMSRGGVWSLEIAFHNPGFFSAVGGHSAALNVNSAPPVYDPIHMVSDAAIRSLRIYLDAGHDDWVLPGMEDLHMALLKNDIEHDYFIRGGRHEDDYWSAHVTEYLLFYAQEW